jgi:hypothetical protein
MTKQKNSRPNETNDQTGNHAAARATYRNRVEKCKTLLEQIEFALDQRIEEDAKHANLKLNWGDVGDAHRAMTLLAEVAAQLGAITPEQAKSEYETTI